MAELKYLAHINLNENQLQNAAMQILSSDPSGFEGHLYYNSSSNVLKFHNGSGYVSLSSASGDITGVTLSGDSGSASDTSANVDLTIAGGTGITTSATGTTVTATIDAAQTGITSVVNSSLEIGRDADNRIKFGTDNQIIFEVDGGDNVIFKTSGEIEATSLDISGNADIDGTLETDALTIGGTAIATVIAGTTVTNATNSAHVLITDNESTDEENQVTFIEGAGGGGANRGLEADGDFTYNPSTGTVSATVFKGDIDANNGDFDGTLEADAITVGGTALNTVIAGVTVANATTAAVATTVTITDNESTNEENALVFTAGGDVDGGNLGLESDGNATYNPSSGTITATIFKGNIDAVDGDFDGTLEADAITIGGTNIVSGNVITSLGAEVSTASDNLIITADTLQVTSANANDPVLQLKNTTNDANGARLNFIKDKGAAGADNDEIGEILFTGDDAAQAQTDFGQILVNIGEADNTDEAGIMTLKVAASDGSTTNLRNGLVLTGHKTSSYVDVTLGAGSSSTVTIPGNLTVSGTTTTVNSTTVNLNDHNIVLDSGNSTSAVVNGAGITIEGGSGDDATFTYSTTGPQFEMKLGSSFEDLQVAKLTASSLDISGDVDVDGTLETDALTIGGTAIATVIAGTTVTTATNANHVLITDNESTNEENQITFIEGAGGGGANRGLEADGDFTYNPSSGTVTATAFAGALTGNVTGNVSGTAATVTGAAQSNITSLGTLTTLTVDDITINGSTISDGGDMLIDVNGDLSLDANGGDFKFLDDGTEFLRITNSSSDAIIRPVADAKDIIFQQRDGTEVARVEDNGTFNIADNKLAINGSAVTVTAAELNLLGGLSTLSGSNTGDEPDASASTKGIVELATTAEALAGSDTSRAVTPAGLAARSFTATIGDGSDDDIAITHSLGTRNVIVQMYDASSYETVIAEVVRTDANTVTINTNSGSTIGSSDVIVLIQKID